MELSNPAPVPEEQTSVSEQPSAENATAANELQRQDLLAQMRSSASWFYWIAALSIINTIIASFNGGTSFILGLGMTQVVDVIVLEANDGAYNAVGWVINILINGVFVLFGVLFTRGSKSALIIGMVLYTLDSLIFLYVSDWFPFGFHLFALFRLYQGFAPATELAKLNQQG